MTGREPGAGAPRPGDPAALADRVARLATRAPGDRRTLVGITGAPGAGKSTVAAAVVGELNRHGERAALVGMDGFHLAGPVLAALGTTRIKGAPETFDALGYVALLRRLRSVPREPVYAPLFDRALEESIAAAVPVGPEIGIVITEGNYLLLDGPPWDAVAPLLDEVWFLDVPDEVRLERLVARHVAYGRRPAEARARAISGSDGANAVLVTATRARADLVITDRAPRGAPSFGVGVADPPG